MLHISFEGKIGIAVGLLSLGIAGLFAPPELDWVGGIAIGLAIAGGLLLSGFHVSPELSERRGVVLVTIGVSLMMVGAVLGLLGAFQMDKLAKKQPLRAASYVGKLETVFAPDIKKPKLQMGNAPVFITSDDEYGKMLFPALRQDQFQVEAIDGKLLVSTKVTDATGKMIAEIVRNEWKVAPPPGTWDRNYSEDALEVKDPEGNIVLQVKLHADRVQLQGVWKLGPEWQRGPRAGRIVIGDGQVILIGMNNKEPLPTIQPLFRYPSELNFGELATR